jgi:3-oxoacyl-[acyl-carrier protein] reductase
MVLNKTVLITGASKNLGNYLTNFFLKKSFNVIGVTKKNKTNLNKNTYICDLSNPKTTKAFFKKIKKKNKKIDLIISCAGSSKKTYKHKEKITDWHIAFKDNFFSFTNLLDSYLEIYKKKSTKIIVISSIASNKITKAPITYSVAKSALNFYATIKAKELAKNKIKINILLPGNILMENNNWSKKLKANQNKVKKYIKENVPLNIFCNPKQIAEMCNYLAGDSGTNITGSKFIIDGGESL